MNLNHNRAIINHIETDYMRIDRACLISFAHPLHVNVAAPRAVSRLKQEVRKMYFPPPPPQVYLRRCDCMYGPGKESWQAQQHHPDVLFVFGDTI